MARKRKKAESNRRVLWFRRRALGYLDSIGKGPPRQPVPSNQAIIELCERELGIEPAESKKRRMTAIEIAIPEGTLLRMPIKNDKKAVSVIGEAFLRSYPWRKLRMRVLEKYGARCQCCGRTAKDGVKIHVDHIKPRRDFPELALEFDNLQVLCEICNHGKGNWSQTDWR